jgi:hypothetical protein
MLRWIFRRGTAALECGVEVDADRSFALRVTPLWAPAAAVVERFDDPLSALERHAELAGYLRESGWRVSEHATPAW